MAQKAIKVLPDDREVVVYLGYDQLLLKQYDDVLALTSVSRYKSNPPGRKTANSEVAPSLVREGLENWSNASPPNSECAIPSIALEVKKHHRAARM